MPDRTTPDRKQLLPDRPRSREHRDAYQPDAEDAEPGQDVDARLLSSRLEIQPRRLHAVLGSSLRAGISLTRAAEHHSVPLSPELHHLLTVERNWSERQYESWVVDLLDHDLLG